MKYSIIALLLTIFMVTSLQGQSDAMKELYDDAEFFFLSEDYNDALSQYMKIYKRGYEHNANINYKIGICYLKIPGQKDKAIDYLKKAIQHASADYKEGTLKEETAPMESFIYLGNAYRVNDELDKAIEAYTTYKSSVDQKKKEEFVFYTDKQIQACKKAKELKKNPLEINTTNLGDRINNSESNYKPVVSGDESTLVYMNELKFYDAVFFSEKKNDQWSYPTNITPQLRSDGDQYTTGLSYDGKILLLAREDFFNSDIYFSTFERGRWSISEPLNKNINTKYWESHACISKDGLTLYFTSNRKGSLGGMDIFVSEKDNKGDWGPAKNISPNINTEFNEETPFISADGNRLYFSSEGHDNMGGFDVFYSEKQNDGTWSKPVNVGYPVCTTDDDLFFVPVGNGNFAYAAQYNADGFGKEDIYRLEIVSGLSSEKAGLKKELKQYAQYRNMIKNAEGK